MKSYQNYSEALRKYLIDTLTEKCEIYAEVIPQDNVQKFILLVDTGGKITDNVNTVKYEPDLMVITQAPENEEARNLAFIVFNTLGAKYDFPITFMHNGNEVTLNFAQIRADETPVPLGNVGGGNFQYLATFKILVGGEYENL